MRRFLKFLLPRKDKHKALHAWVLPAINKQSFTAKCQNWHNISTMPTY